MSGIFLNNFKKAERSTEDLDDVLNDVEKQSQYTESGIDDLSDSLDREADSSKNAKNETSQLNENIKETGDKSDESKGSISEFNDVLGKVGFGFSVAGVLTGFINIGKQALAAADEVDDAIRKINVATGASGTALNNYGDIVAEISKELGYSKDSVAQTVGAVATLNRGIDTASLKDLSSQYQSLDGLLKSVGQNADIQQIDAAFKKWNISTQEQGAYLKYFYDLSQDTGVSVNELAGKLADGDREFQLMGLSAEQASKYIADMSYAGEIDDVNKLISAVQKLQVLKSSEMGSDAASQRYIQNIFNSAESMKDESAAAEYLQKNLEISGKSALTFAGIMFSGTKEIEETTVTLKKYGDTLTDIDKMYPSLEQKNQKMAEDWNYFLKPVGDSLQNIRDNIAKIIDQEDRLTTIRDLLYVRGWLGNGDITIGTGQPAPTVDNSDRRTINNTTVNQYISAPVYDTTAVEVAAQRADYARRKNPTY